MSISVLGLFAAIQMLALLWHYGPLVRKEVAESAAQARLAQQQAAQQAQAQAQAPAAQPPADQTTLPPGDLQKVERLLSESDRNFRIGQFDAALKPLEELEVILPGDPNVLYRKAQILIRLDQPGEAAVALEEAVKHPGLPAEVRAQMEKQIEQFLRQADSMGLTRSPRSSAAEGGGDEMREDTGLQPGANLGIVDVRLKEGKPGMKNLLVAVKSRPGAAINVQDVKIYVYFYEESEDGEVLITESKVVTQWLSPPVDWAANEPELLEGLYILPESGLPGSSTANGSPGRKYHGYVVAVYYNKELQDFRSDPARLAKDFPLPLYLKENVE